MSGAGSAARAVRGTLVKVDPDMKVFIKFLIWQNASRHADIKIIEELDHEYWLLNSAGIDALKQELQQHHEHMHKEVKDSKAWDD